MEGSWSLRDASPRRSAAIARAGERNVVKGGMPKKNPTPEDEKPQKDRFIEAAEEAGVTDEGFDRAMKKLAPPKKPKR